MTRPLFKTLFAAGLLAASVQAHAILVFDPSNWTQNYLTAFQTAKQLSEQITQTQQQIKLVLDSARMSKQLADYNQLGPKIDQYKLLQEAQAANQTYMQTLGNADSFVSDVVAHYGASGFTGSMTDYLAHQARSAQLGQNSAQALFQAQQNTVAALKAASTRRKEALAKIGPLDGITQVGQAITAQNDNTIEVLQTIAQIQATQANVTAEQRAAAVGKEQASQAQTDKYLDSNATNAKAYFKQ
jgi:P-type conjugative transfer protein TrbJ